MLKVPFHAENGKVHKITQLNITKEFQYKELRELVKNSLFMLDATSLSTFTL